MSRITITISIDVPEGATVAVSSGEELASLPTVAVTNGDAVSCAIHHKPMRQGRYGPFCTQKAAPGEPADAKGYCSWRPAR